MNIPVQKDQLIFGTSFALLFILWNYLFIGIKMDLVIFALTIGSGAILSRTFFKFILAFSAFIIFLIIYDGLQIFHNYELNSVSIAELYNLEKSLFGFMYNGEKIIPCEYFLENQMPLLSFFLGFSYLMWMPAPFIFTGYMYWVDKSLMLRYSYAFLFVNLLGFIGYYVYPAAPPWYYFKYGAEFITGLNGDAGLLVNFDKIVGFPVFESIYNRGSNVFCAIPSLHCAFMVINIYYAYQLKSKFWIVTFWLLGIGTWVGAVYSQHHYVVDVILGILTALLSIFLYEKLNVKKMFSRLNVWIYERISH